MQNTDGYSVHRVTLQALNVLTEKIISFIFVFFACHSGLKINYDTAYKENRWNSLYTAISVVRTRNGLIRLIIAKLTAFLKTNGYTNLI